MSAALHDVSVSDQVHEHGRAGVLSLGERLKRRAADLYGAPVLIDRTPRCHEILGRAKRRSWCWRCRRLPAPTRGLSCVALFGIGSMSGMDALSMVTAVPHAVFTRRLILSEQRPARCGRRLSRL